jgi:hypothetical protein
MLDWRLLWWECNNSVWTHISSLCQISLAISHTNGSLIKQNNLQNYCCHKSYVLFIVNARVLFKYWLLPLVSSLSCNQLINLPFSQKNIKNIWKRMCMSFMLWKIYMNHFLYSRTHLCSTLWSLISWTTTQVHNKDCNVSTSTSKFEISWDTLQLAQWQIEELNICILYPKPTQTQIHIVIASSNKGKMVGIN